MKWTHSAAEPPQSGMPERRVRVSSFVWTLSIAVAPACSTAIDTTAEDLVAAEATTSVDPLAYYLSLEPVDGEGERRALDGLERAIEDWLDGDPLSAAHAVDSILALLPTLADWRPLLHAELLVPTGDTAAVRRTLDGLDADTGFESRWGWRVRVEALEAAGDSTRARDGARAAASMETNPAVAAEQWLHAGRLGLAAGDTAGAREDLWRALSHGSRIGAARTAARLLDPLEGPVSPADEVQLGRALLAGGSWREAHRRLSPHMAAGAPPSSDAEEVRLGVGRALFEMGRYIESEDVLAPLAAATDASEATIEALYWRGRAALERGILSAAEASFDRVATLAPDSPLATDGRVRLLQRELRTGFGPRARTLLDGLLVGGVRGAAAEGLVVELGTLLYLEGDLVGASRTFGAYLDRSERTAARQQAGYWAGLAHERSGARATASAMLAEVHAEEPFTVYGVFAGERIGAPVVDPDLPAGPVPIPGLDVELRNAITRLKVHRIVPTSGSFAHELERLTEHFFSRGDGAYDFGDALVAGGFPLQAISLGREIRRVEGAWNLRLLRIVHPLPHRDEIVRESAQRGLDPFFVAAVIRQESAFDARIVSVSGAVGLMQLMLPTAREVAGSIGIRLTPESLTDPETNIRLGTTYLRTMLNRFDGRAEDALAAYNAGPSRIRQWRDGPTYRDRDVFMEHIPLQETRNYVKVVQQYARIYAALYGCGDFEPCFGLSYPEVLARSPLAVGAPGVSTAR